MRLVNLIGRSTGTLTLLVSLVVIAARVSPSGGILAFTSNRDGNWELYLMDIAHALTRRLTQDTAEDFKAVWSPDGERIAFHSNRGGDYSIYIMQVFSGEIVPVTGKDYDEFYPAWSPDGRWIAFQSDRDGNFEIYAMNTACLTQPDTCEDTILRLTDNSAADFDPAWSPDGEYIAFCSYRDLWYSIFMIEAQCLQSSLDCGSSLRRVTDHWADDCSPAWAPDGTRLAFVSRSQERLVNLYIINVASGETLTPVVDVNMTYSPTWSPDGQYIAFASDQDGNRELYLMRDGGTDIQRLTWNTAYDLVPAWKP